MNATQLDPGEFQHKAGERIGNYVLVAPLGTGGFAEVWQANDPSANRLVAMKIFFDRVTQQPKIWKAIREEPKKQPEHERIVPIYYCHLDSDESPGPYYVVMKLMPGGTLDEVLQQRTKLPPAEAVKIIRDVVSGLEYAHSRGIIHRDIKPSNILFDANGRAALADFGIAKDLNKATTTNSTIFGGVVGTATYMSHEQGEGGQVTKSTDIYSLGTVLYEMLCGKVPFEGPTDTAIIIARSRHEPPPIHLTAPEIPEKLEKVVLNCLQRDLDLRYPDCQAFLRALDWAEKADVPAPKPLRDEKPDSTNPPATGRGKMYAFGGVMAALVLAAVGYFATRGSNPKPEGKGSAGSAQVATTPTPTVKASPPDWARVAYNDPRLSKCQSDDAACLQAKKDSDNLKAMPEQEWKQVRFDNAILNRCMEFPRCMERKAQAAKIIAMSPADWPKVKDKQLLADCMGYAQCLSVRPVRAPRGPITDTSDDRLTTCCAQSSDPGACSVYKKAQRLENDCGGPYGR